ncbi:hypothetical protein K438DRAFT_629949 [Mycena galopus ATCC 62051]|nr:hypothetical protein K438DRAFT_629949 [Mycena galopus ATCC 62051]
MLGPPALAQEIWNYIMVFLHGRTEDLKACSLVSRTLGIAAQSQLFHTVAVLPTPKQHSGSTINPSCTPMRSRPPAPCARCVSPRRTTRRAFAGSSSRSSQRR